MWLQSHDFSHEYVTSVTHHVCMRVFYMYNNDICVHVFIYMLIHVCIHTYIHTYIHTNIHTGNKKTVSRPTCSWITSAKPPEWRVPVLFKLTPRTDTIRHLCHFRRYTTGNCSHRIIIITTRGGRRIIQQKMARVSWNVCVCSICVYMCMCLSVWSICVCWVYVCVCVYIHIYVCVCVCMNVYMFIY